MGKVPLDDLNPGQLAAVTGPSAHTLVLAGAGTGKTTVLTRRIAWMCADKGVPPNRVLAVTFTNKAAAEMTERIEALMDGNCDGLWSGTFHGLCHKFLRIHTEAAGLHPQWAVIDADDQKKLVKRVMDHPDLSSADDLDAGAIVEHINSRKDKGLRPSASPNVPPLERAYQIYDQRCKAIGAVDFGELLLLTKETLERDDALREHYGNRFRHILVDEFQDTNKVQYDLVKTLAGPKSRIWAVGDDDQSIYAWRGAEPENMQLFRRQLAGENVVKLEDNYRSTGTVLGAANKLIANNEDRIGKVLRPVKGDGELIDEIVTEDAWGEGRAIAEATKNWIGRGNPAKDVAVLSRTTAQMRIIEQVFVGEGIPYTIKGGVKFYEREEIRDVVGYMRLMRSTDDDVAFDRILNKPPRGLGERTAAEIRAKASREGTSCWTATVALANDPQVGARARTAMKAFVDLIEGIREHSEQMSVAEAADLCMERSGLKRHHGAKDDVTAQNKVENLEELIVACAEHGTIDEFIDSTALEPAEIGDQPADAVQIMTMHSAKGLEFPQVILCGMDSGTFPHPRSENEDEERRLAYVGVTRAKDKLILTRPRTRAFQGNSERPKALERSKFLDELPADLIRVDDRSKSRRPRQQARGGRKRYGQWNGKRRSSGGWRR